MTILEKDKLDILAGSKDGKTIELVMVHGSSWDKEAENALLYKISHYEELVYLPKFCSEYGGKLIKIDLKTSEKPPERIIKLLKSRGVRFEVI